MAILVSPNLRRFHNSEFIQYTKNVVDICNLNDPARLLIKNEVDELAATTIDLNRFFDSDKVNSFTAKVQELDDRRDKAIIGIRAYADCFRFHFNAEKAEASRLILASIDKHGKNLANLNYNAETKVITALKDDFTNNPLLAKAIITLNLTEWLDELDTANRLFSDYYLSRTQSKAAKPHGNLVNMRIMATEKYRLLIDQINARWTINKKDPIAADYEKLMNELDVISTEQNRVIVFRASSSVNEVTFDDTNSDIKQSS